jgi:alpha-beta hydrolase superfamily lysophospholipase
MRGSEGIAREWYHVDNGDGWDLALYRTHHPAKVDREKRPVFIVPGYGMNSYIFHYHPTDRSLAATLADHGHEVFTVDLREQGRAKKVTPGKQGRYGLRDLALTDFAAAIEAARSHTVSRHPEIDLLGASLGGTLTMLYRTQHRRPAPGRVVMLGSPIRWLQVHPLLKLIFGSPRLAGAVELQKTRALAALALPAVAKLAPWALKIYMNPDATDLTHYGEMVNTVEDPSRFVNREIAQWIKDGDLVVNGRNLSDDIEHFDDPLCTIYANGDGIVPRETATFAHTHVKSGRKTLVKAGTRELPYSHADMFIAREASRQVFAPLLAFLEEAR